MASRETQSWVLQALRVPLAVAEASRVRAAASVGSDSEGRSEGEVARVAEPRSAIGGEKNFTQTTASAGWATGASTTGTGGRLAPRARSSIELDERPLSSTSSCSTGYVWMHCPVTGLHSPLQHSTFARQFWPSLRQTQWPCEHRLLQHWLSRRQFEPSTRQSPSV